MRRTKKGPFDECPRLDILQTKANKKTPNIKKVKTTLFSPTIIK